MWDDVVVGSGCKGNSAVHVFEIEGDHNVSQNSVSYWVCRCYLGLGMTIFKHTAEGAKLKEMIDRKAGKEAIEEWLADVLMEHVDKERLKDAINSAVKEAFEAGRAEKAAEMRAVMMV